MHSVRHCCIQSIETFKLQLVTLVMNRFNVDHKVYALTKQYMFYTWNIIIVRETIIKKYIYNKNRQLAQRRIIFTQSCYVCYKLYVPIDNQTCIRLYIITSHFLRRTIWLLERLRPRTRRSCIASGVRTMSISDAPHNGAIRSSSAKTERARKSFSSTGIGS